MARWVRRLAQSKGSTVLHPPAIPHLRRSTHFQSQQTPIQGFRDSFRSYSVHISFTTLRSLLSGTIPVAECLGLSVSDLAGGGRGREAPEMLPRNRLSRCLRRHTEKLIGEDFKSNDSAVPKPPRKARPAPGGWTCLAGARTVQEGTLPTPIPAIGAA
ncbi:hypothetical protein P7K49_025210 [Saguinus oedipus]|uniref:Uncharacterized protein n=1 Tax=Saguinus oedipus TaxID=9490 RepID=A0ABQ9UGJ4_SAGOE|nr:hypothetical protein P7K49_025210 [Saguinus oedipus]